MSTLSENALSWLTAWMVSRRVPLWGVADLGEFSTPTDEDGRGFPRAVSFAIPMDLEIMVGIQDGPNQAYADEYERVNRRINELSVSLASEIRARGRRAKPLAASDRSDPIDIKGDFPHKTAATRAGLGWIGRHCQLVTRRFGSWIRLGTVFTDLTLPSGTPFDRDYCGRCNKCVTACPAEALTGNSWVPGLPREEILDAQACDQWKKEHYPQYHHGHNCGICSAVCPCGLKLVKETRGGWALARKADEKSQAAIRSAGPPPEKAAWPSPPG